MTEKRIDPFLTCVWVRMIIPTMVFTWYFFWRDRRSGISDFKPKIIWYINIFISKRNEKSIREVVLTCYGFLIFYCDCANSNEQVQVRIDISRYFTGRYENMISLEAFTARWIFIVYCVAFFFDRCLGSVGNFSSFLWRIACCVCLEEEAEVVWVSLAFVLL